MRSAERKTRGRCRNWALLLALTAGSPSAAAAQASKTPPVPEGPMRQVELTPPAAAAAPAPALPPELMRPGATFTLAQVIDIALANNPLTRGSYLRARAAAAELGSARAAYYPTLDATANLTRSSQSVLGGQFEILQTNYGGTVSLDYLLLDLGGRTADAEEARLAVLAADWTHNATIQNVVLDVQRAFVEYLNAKAQLESATANRATAETALDAAKGRHDAGVATIAEVLLAQTALSQAQLAVDTFNGRVMVVRGSLATAMGLPANIPYDIGSLPADLPIERAAEAVEPLIEQARTLRPDLAAARLEAEQAATHVRSVRSQGLPVLTANASYTRTYYKPSTFASYGDSWSGRLLLTVPLFTGFENLYDVRKAEEDAAAARTSVDALEQRVILEVWTSYYALQTAAQLVKTTRDLFASAEQSQQVALGRYREGVGTVIDLLAAQAALADARAQEALARSAWIMALAQLAHDTGAASPVLGAGVTVTEETR